MNVHWLLSGSDMVNNTVLHSDINLAGDKYTILKPFCNIESIFPRTCDYGPVMTMGSLSTCVSVYNYGFYPGTYCNLKKLKCSTYYNYFSRFLLNSNYIMLPLGDILRRKEDIFNWVGESDSVFIRPDSGFKTFTGHIIERETFEKDVANLSCIEIPVNELCLLSKPVNIVNEWRFVVGDNIITSSRYRTSTELSVLAGSPKKVDEFVKSVINSVDWRPDSCYTMDIAELIDGTYKVIELNSFSASGLYACDMSKIVSEVRKLVIRDYKKEYDD